LAGVGITVCEYIYDGVGKYLSPWRFQGQFAVWRRCETGYDQIGGFALKYNEMVDLDPLLAEDETEFKHLKHISD